MLFFKMCLQWDKHFISPRVPLKKLQDKVCGACLYIPEYYFPISAPS